MGKLQDDVREIVEELDADGSGFYVREAANLLVNRYEQSDGSFGSDAKPLVRKGASLACKEYMSVHVKRNRKAEIFAGKIVGEQGDFGESHDDFGFQWLRTYSALDEALDANRKVLIRMTLPEILAVIQLKRKKASEATAIADKLQDIIDNNLHWYDEPDLTLADILGVQE